MFGRGPSNRTGARATRTRDTRERRSARGETLIETLCTLTILSVAIVALVLAMGYDFSFDHQSRSAADADTLLVAFADNLQTLAYQSCGGTTPYSTTASSVLPTQLNGITVIGSGTPSGPTQYLAQISTIKYWDGNTSPIGWTSSCPSSGDPGAQQLTITVTPGDGVVSRTMSIVKRST
ncbi:MAG TPA: prepilin-type N-terminal cleavage/methylation domain-containing protein [Acidimicrobiia bacterium]|jgi:Tfp pilus assembly protein PilV